MLFGYDKVNILNLPTPLVYLSNISEELGIQFYIKRDDVSEIGLGGNKLRKLEYILKEAQNQEATMLLTRGGVQTNHGRLTAAVAAKYGMKCVIICIGEYPGEISSNLLLDRIMGADVIIKESDGRPEEEQYDELIDQVTHEYESKGEKVYYIPLGGSDDIGFLGYYECARELISQANEAGIHNARVFTPVGSIGTFMGMHCGFKNENSHLSCDGIAIMLFDEHKDVKMVEYFNSVKAKYNLNIEASLKDFHIERDYVRGGYNQPSKEVRDAICLMAGKEGIFLDPCYTGKCFAAIIDMIKEGKIQKGEKIIFVHTGGSPGLYTKHHRIEFEEELIDGLRIVKN